MKPVRRSTTMAPLALGLLLGLGNCHQAILTAPPGSTITLIANPEFIPAHGGVSVISAFVLEPAGTPVADGTGVQFFTNLGRIDPLGKTSDGIARVNLVSDSRSGTACVQAFSGGPAAAAPTTTLSATPVLAAGTLACGATVTIGSALPATVIVTAFPQRLTDKRASLITANVADANGNPVANVPVIFQVDGATEFMDSQSSPTFTDNNGQAQDLMRTRYDPDAAQKQVTVKATTANGKTGEVKVTIN